MSWSSNVLLWLFDDGAGVRAVVVDASFQGFTLENRADSLYTGIAAIHRALGRNATVLPRLWSRWHIEELRTS
jgi:hypothetical protein